MKRTRNTNIPAPNEKPSAIQMPRKCYLKASWNLEKRERKILLLVVSLATKKIHSFNPGKLGKVGWSFQGEKCVTSIYRSLALLCPPLRFPLSILPGKVWCSIWQPGGACIFLPCGNVTTIVSERGCRKVVEPLMVNGNRNTCFSFLRETYN